MIPLPVYGVLRRFAFAWLLGSLCAAPAAAQQYPRFTGERLYRVGAEDTGYQQVLDRIHRVEREAPETYYLVVASSTGSGSTATRDYTDQLYQRWRSDARTAGKVLDPDRHVILVIGVQNRQISVHAGVRLQNDLGFRGSTIDNEVVQPVFIPHARAGEYARGAAALVDAIHRWLRRTEAAQAQTLRAREQQRRRERAAVSAGLGQERGQLELLSAQIVQEGRAGLATGSLEKRLLGIAPLLQQAEVLVSGQPETAGAALKKAREARVDLERRLLRLRTLQGDARQAHQRAAAALEGAQSELERARAIGLAVGELPSALQQVGGALERAGRLRTTDYEQALAESAVVESRARDVVAAIRTAEQRREAERRHTYFMRHTLPLAIGLTLMATALLLVAALHVRHLRLKSAVMEQLRTLLKELVRCMERLGDLTERHKLLMGADPDFTAPMAGRTLALYQETEGTLQRAWGVWDQLVFSREAIQKLIAEEGPLGRKRLQSACDRLQELHRSRELLTQLDTVAVNLDRLNAAHEEAGVAIEALEVEQAQAADRRAQLETRKLSLQPYRPAELEAEAAAAEAGVHLEADPLATREIAERGAAQAREWNAWMLRVLAAAAEHVTATERAHHLETTAGARRAEGYLLTEPAGNPDSSLADARAALEAGWRHLQAGADGEAWEALGAAAERLRQGEAAVEGQVKGRAFCEQDLPSRRAETQRLKGHLAEAARAREALTQEFARSCWQSVEGNCTTAEAALAEFERLCQQAESRMHPRTQHYLAAQALLQEVARGQVEAEAGLTTVEQTLTTLRAIRSRVQSDVPRIQELDRTIRVFIEGNAQSIRLPTREGLGAGHTAVGASAAAAALQPPDWVIAARQLQEAEIALAAALALARQDVADHGRVLERLQSTERAYAAAAAYIQSETADRPAAAYRLSQALRLLEEARSAAQTPGADWPTLETQLDQATAMANSALEMAREDVRLHSRARSELRAAEIALGAADRYFGHGIRGETGRASGALSQASAALQSQRYEDVVRLAAEAVMLAQAAQRAAEARVRQIEDEIRRRREAEEAEERRREAARSSSFTSSSSSSSSSSSFSSGSSSSSFGSGTSQSSW